jgi:hypothetical protein
MVIVFIHRDGCADRRQASLWLQGDMYRARQQELGVPTKDRLGVSHILHGVDGISINDSKLLSTSMNDSDFDDDVDVSWFDFVDRRVSALYCIPF